MRSNAKASAPQRNPNYHKTWLYLVRNRELQLEATLCPSYVQTAHAWQATVRLAGPFCNTTVVLSHQSLQHDAALASQPHLPTHPSPPQYKIPPPSTPSHDPPATPSNTHPPYTPAPSPHRLYLPPIHLPHKTDQPIRQANGMCPPQRIILVGRVHVHRGIGFGFGAAVGVVDDVKGQVGEVSFSI